MHSKSQHIFFIFMGVLIIFIVLLMGRTWLAQKTAEQYMTELELTNDKITYSSIAAPMWSDGVILYQVQLPKAKTPHTIDKIIVHKKENQITLRALNISLNMTEILRQQNPLVLKQQLFSYQPMKDVLKRPLESLAFCGLDTVQSDLTVHLTQREDIIYLSAELDMKGLAHIQLTGEMEKDFQLDDVFQNPLILMKNGIAQPTIVIQNKGLIDRYNDYLNRVNIQPIHMKKGVIKITPENPIILNQIIATEQ